MPEAMDIFDRKVVRRHRERAAARLPEHDFLFRDVADRLCDRLSDVARHFPVALDLGCHGGEIAQTLCGRGRIETLVQCDLSHAMAKRAGGLSLVADEEWLPFAPQSFDLVISNLSLHWVNDLPGCLAQIRRVLKPDGLFLGAILGAATLAELRHALMDAEMTTSGGVSPRVSPFADVRDCGHLLQRAGFALPVADCDTVTVTYTDAMRLMADLRGMGETNAVKVRAKTMTPRSTLLRAVGRYHEMFATDDGRIPATFQIVTMTAWAPHPEQQQPLRPGTARARLADALGGAEQPLGDKP